MANSPLGEVIQKIRNTALLGEKAELTDRQLPGSFINHRESDALEARYCAMYIWFGVCQRVLGNYHDAEDAFQATFLVFVRKVAVVPHAKIGNWLYGVAHQTALKAKANRLKRRTREQTLACDVAIEEPSLPVVLDQELSRLPEKYRHVIVLCDLEGKTKREAARQLGVPEGTVASRVARARAMLAKQLQWTQPGRTISASAISIFLANCTASAGAPSSLTAATIKTVRLLASGHDIVGTALPEAVVLWKGVMKLMFISKIKTLAATLCALLCSTCLVVGVAQTWHKDGEVFELPAKNTIVLPFKPLPSKQSPKRSDASADNEAQTTSAITPPVGPVAPRQDPAPPGEKKTPKWLSEKVDKAWSDAEFAAIPRDFDRELGLRGQRRDYTMPVFMWLGDSDKKPSDPATLPPPEVPFGVETIQADDVLLQGLARFRNLHALMVRAPHNGEMTDVGMKSVAAMKNLFYLELLADQVTDAGMKELAGLKTLRHLYLWTKNVTDVGLKELAGLKDLRTLEINLDKATENGLKELIGLTNLRLLTLTGPQFTDGALLEIANLTNLMDLRLEFTQATAVGLKHIAKLRNLKSLTLDTVPISDLALKELTAFDHLQQLHLEGCTELTDAAFKQIALLKKLDWLSLEGTKVTGAGLRELAALNKLQFLQLNSTQLTDEGLLELAGQKSLQSLYISGTKVTVEGVTALQMALPNCNIVR